MQNPFQRLRSDILADFYKFSRIKPPNTQIFANKNTILQIFANKAHLYKIKSWILCISSIVPEERSLYNPTRKCGVEKKHLSY